MAYPQLVRLKQDYRDLQYFLLRLEKEGRFDRAEQIKSKLMFLIARINAYEDSIVQKAG